MGCYIFQRHKDVFSSVEILRGGVLVGLESRGYIRPAFLLLASYGLLHKDGDAGIWKRSLPCEGEGGKCLVVYTYLLGDKFSR